MLIDMDEILNRKWTEEELALARKTLDAIKARMGEDIDKWATLLDKEAAEFTD